MRESTLRTYSRDVKSLPRSSLAMLVLIGSACFVHCKFQITTPTTQLLQTESYTKDVEEVVQELETNLTEGLSSLEADSRLSQYGKNKFDTEEGVTWPQILAYHLFSFLNLVLLVALALSFVVVSWIDAGVIAFVILVNVAIGFSQEYKSEKTMAALRNFSSPSCIVLRDGDQKEIPAEELVPGDILIVRQGDKIAADARIFRLASLEIDESILTGESDLVKKKIDPLEVNEEEEISLGDRKNLLFMNTVANKGKGRAVVFATGNETEMGKIANTLMHGKKARTPLQQRMDKLGILLSIVAVGCIAVVLLTGWAWNTFDIYPEGLRTASAAAVSIIPQSVVVVTSLTLSVGVSVMAKKNALIRKLAAVETLGNITNICSDKTGTLTQGKMSVTAMRLPNGKILRVTGEGLIPRGDIEDEHGDIVDVRDDPILNRLVLIGSLCNAATITQKEPEQDRESEKEEWTGLGSPTEVALIVLGTKVGVTKQSLAHKYQFRTEFPFDSSIKRMSSVYYDQEMNESIVFVKGAPEQLLELCPTYLKDAASVKLPLTEDVKQQLKVLNHDMAHEGLRVLGVAYRDLPGEVPHERGDIEQQLTFVGFFGIRDPPREGVKEAIETCHDAGIAVHMVTGDHPFTAKAIAKEVGIFVPQMPEARIEKLTMTASQFNKLTDEELHKLPSLPLVIARCSPESKVRMVQELQRRGKRVAMLGDGVNDSPAIKLADIGVAMGINGTDITKEAADVVLLDDNFATIVAAIREGRRIFHNIRRFIIYLIVSNISEASIIVFGVAFSLDPPLTPMEVLWVNLVTAAPPAFILGVVPEKIWYMNKYKRKVDEEFYDVETIFDILFYGFLIGGFGLAQFCISRFVFDQSVKTSQGATFANVTILLMLFSYVCREMRGNFWRGGFLKSYWLHLAVLFGIGTIFFTFYTPVFEDHVFDHRRADWRSWLVAIASAFIFLTITEIYKLIKKPFRKRSHAKSLRKQAAHDDYMLFNPSPAQLVHEEEYYPENEAEEADQYERDTRSESSGSEEEGRNEEVELQVIASPLLSTLASHHQRRSVQSPALPARRKSTNSPSLRKSAHSPSPRSPYLQSPRLNT